jgi:ribonuclease III
MSENWSSRLSLFAEELGYEDHPLTTLEVAFTHRTYAHESKDPVPDNQRLEFLGDAVIGLAVADRLMTTSPELNEGQLSKARARLINAKMLAEVAHENGLDPLLRIGKGEPNMGESAREARLADAFESLIGALYLDLGFEKACAWVWEILSVKHEGFQQKSPLISAKSRLQLWAHQKYKLTPVYESRALSPDLKRADLFEATVSLLGHLLGAGEGPSKKEAEQHAAERALLNIDENKLTLPMIPKRRRRSNFRNRYSIKKPKLDPIKR